MQLLKSNTQSFQILLTSIHVVGRPVVRQPNGFADKVTLGHNEVLWARKEYNPKTV